MTWTSIKWPKVEYDLIKLQIKILEAYKSGDKQEVERYQLILINSFGARALAIKKVTTNLEKIIPGIDNILYQNNEEKVNAIHALHNATPALYKASPVKRVMIPKQNKPNEFRYLDIPTLYDRAVQALYALALKPIAIYTSDPNSFGYKEGIGTWDAISKLEKIIHSAPYPKVLFKGNIKVYFYSIYHQWIMDHIPLPKPILHQFIKAGFILKGSYKATLLGVTPLTLRASAWREGGIISTIIGNMVLDGLGKHMSDAVVKAKPRIPLGIQVVRYADDFIITGPSSVKMAWVWPNVVHRTLNVFLTQRGLSLNQNKSVITRIEEDKATFLGVDLIMTNSLKGKKSLLILPGQNNVLSLLKRMAAIFKKMRTVTPGQLIELLNPIIRGWSEYYKYANSTRTFRQLDRKLWSLYFGWLIHKYPRTARSILYKTNFTYSGINLTKNNTHIPCGHVKDGERIRYVLLKSFQDVKTTKYTTNQFI